MNLDNLDMIKLREDIFDKYRLKLSELRTLEQENIKLHEQMEDLHQKIRQIHEEHSTLKSLIHIMLVEDCDPVTAKLKFSEHIKQQEVEEKMVASTTYGYGFASSNKYISTSSPNFYDDH